jgi:hypothetical protein
MKFRFATFPGILAIIDFKTAGAADLKVPVLNGPALYRCDVSSNPVVGEAPIARCGARGGNSQMPRRRPK